VSVQHRPQVGGYLNDQRLEQTLRLHRVALGLLEEPLEAHALVRRVLIDQKQLVPVRGHDVGEPVLPENDRSGRLRHRPGPRRLRDAAGAKELAALYKEKFNEGIYDKVALAWASLQVYEQAIKGVKSLDQEKIRDYIRTETFDLVVGPTRFADNGMPTISTLLDVQWVDGKRIVVWPKKDRVLGKPIDAQEIVFPKPAW